jgi:hypothetical protein
LLVNKRIYQISHFLMDYKNLVIGALVAYVVIDVLISMMSSVKAPSLFEKLFALMGDTNVMLATGIGLFGGAGVAYFLEYK